jgi:hypothetical protein
LLFYRGIFVLDLRESVFPDALFGQVGKEEERMQQRQQRPWMRQRESRKEASGSSSFYC